MNFNSPSFNGFSFSFQPSAPHQPIELGNSWKTLPSTPPPSLRNYNFQPANFPQNFGREFHVTYIPTFPNPSFGNSFQFGNAPSNARSLESFPQPYPKIDRVTNTFISNFPPPKHTEPTFSDLSTERLISLNQKLFTPPLRKSILSQFERDLFSSYNVFLSELGKTDRVIIQVNQVNTSSTTSKLNQAPHSLSIQVATIESQSGNFAMTQAKVTTIKVAANIVHFFTKTLSRIGMEVAEVPFSEQTQITTRSEASHAQYTLSLDQMVKSHIKASPDRRFGFSRSMEYNSLLKDPTITRAVCHFFQELATKYGPHSSPECYREKAELPPLGSSELGTNHVFCGINNTRESLFEAQQVTYQSLDKQLAISMHHMHDSSMLHGLFTVGFQKMGIPRSVIDYMYPVLAPQGLVALEKLSLQSTYFPTSVDRELQEVSTRAQEILSQNNPSLKQLYTTFSNGGAALNEILKRLPPSYRDTVIVICVGTTEIINPKLAHKVFTIIGDKDWPSHVCNGGMGRIMRRAEKEDIRIIEQKQTMPGLGGHYFTQPDYQDHINLTTITEIKSKYEIY